MNLAALRAGALIRADWMAGAAAGALMLALHGWLARLYALPEALLLLIGLANLGYAAVSFTLDRLSRGDQVPLLRLIAVANMGWALLCLAWAARWAGEASAFGMLQLLGEAVFVGGLGALEWRAGSAQRMK
jgi:hypothetical protein